MEKIEQRLGYNFKSPETLRLALIHMSADPRVGHNNQRLEFLGDSVLSTVVTTILIKRFTADEGVLTVLRSNATKRESLAREAKLLGLWDDLKMSQSARTVRGKGRDSILEDAYEALVGALYLDGGLEAVQGVLGASIDRLVTRAASLGFEGGKDPKTRLQEWLQARGFSTPSYTADPLDVGFAATVSAQLEDGEHRHTATGRSKKSAEKRAAEGLLNELEG